MRTIRYIILFLIACSAFSATAAGEETLTFVTTDGSTVSFSTNGLVITFDSNSHAVINNDETSATLSLDNLDYMCFGMVEPATVTGDVDGDGEISISDINMLIDIILTGNEDQTIIARADVNGDAEITVSDVNMLIDIILNL